MYINRPRCHQGVIGEEVTHEELGVPWPMPPRAASCHFATENDEDCINKVKILLSYLPDSCHSPLPWVNCSDSPDRECPELDSMIPDKATRGYDMKKGGHDHSGQQRNF